MPVPPGGELPARRARRALAGAGAVLTPTRPAAGMQQGIVLVGVRSAAQQRGGNDVNIVVNIFTSHLPLLGATRTLASRD